jgi:hypothetical protein
MDGEEEDSGLLNIGLSDSEDAVDQGAAVATTRADKHAQSEADFQKLKYEYQPKIENGEVSLRILPD